MEDPQPAAPPAEGAAPAAEPAAGEPAAAASPTEPQSQSQPAQTDETAAWLQGKGVDPNDPEAFQKVAKMAYNSEKQMTKATQEASELRKSLTPGQPAQPPDGTQADPMNEFIQDYRRDKLISGFKESHDDWKEQEPAMVKLLNEASPSGYTYSQLVNAGVLPLETIYAMAKASAPDNTAQVQAQAKTEVLQTLANTQRAGGGNAQASNPNPQAPTEDPILAGIKRGLEK